jgi:hypothetical protein
MSCERDFFTLKGEKFTFSNNLWSKNPFAKVEKIPFAKESRSDDIGQYDQALAHQMHPFKTGTTS